MYAIEKFESHPSILKIKEKVNSPIFNFRNVSLVHLFFNKIIYWITVFLLSISMNVS